MSMAGLARVYTDIQGVRIALGNKTWATENAGNVAIPQIYVDMIDQLKDMEKGLIREASQQLKTHPAWDTWGKHVKGFGPTLAMQLFGQIGDIGRFDTVSKLWKYCGLGVTDGKADRRRKGEKLSYSPRLKTLLYNIGTSFLKTKSPYRDIYDEKKLVYETRKDESGKEWSKLRIHLASMRIMEKIFLAHMWQKWREAEGLLIREEYVFDYLGHTTRYKPEDFMKP